MTQLPSPPDDRSARRPLLHEATDLSLWLITQIRDHITPQAGKPVTAAFLRRLLRHFIVPAEAVLRRAIYLIAATLAPASAPEPRHRNIAHPGEGPGLAQDLAQEKSAKLRTPLFRLTEPLPRPATDYIPVNQRPRISVPGLTPLAPEKTAPSKSDPERLYARVARRFAALEAAWADPRAAAARLQRLRARAPTKPPALSFRAVPGARAKPINAHAGRILQDINAAVFELALRSRQADTS